MVKKAGKTIGSLMEKKAQGGNRKKRSFALYAGETFMDHSSHAVLWTKKSFKGNIQIDYDYTRLDETKKCVKIIYFYAKGTINF